MPNPNIVRRRLKRALDTTESRIITSDDLLGMPSTEYQQVRRAATLSVKAGSARYLCCRCGHPVYAPNYAKGPGWKHFRGAPETCEWWTGETSSADEVSARQFQGQQESPLHVKAKNLVADLLRADHRVADVVVDEILYGETGYKKPDVRAEFGDRPIAVELQLSTTQIPVIVERELFYRQEGRHLIWLAWDFEPCPYQDVRQAFRDIATAHSENLFTIDAETIEESKRRKCLAFRVLWWNGEGCHHKVATLDDLEWPKERLPFVVRLEQPARLNRHEIVVEASPEAAKPSPTPPLSPQEAGERWAQEHKRLWKEVAASKPSWEIVKSDFWYWMLMGADADELLDDEAEADLAIDVINLAVSFDNGHPIASRQRNLIELLTTFLSSTKRHPYGRLAQRIAVASGRADLLDRPAIKKKLSAAFLVQQRGGQSPAAKIISALFPEWIKQKAEAS